MTDIYKIQREEHEKRKYELRSDIFVALHGLRQAIRNAHRAGVISDRAMSIPMDIADTLFELISHECKKFDVGDA